MLSELSDRGLLFIVLLSVFTGILQFVYTSIEPLYRRQHNEFAFVISLLIFAAVIFFVNLIAFATNSIGDAKIMSDVSYHNTKLVGSLAFMLSIIIMSFCLDIRFTRNSILRTFLTGFFIS